MDRQEVIVKFCLSCLNIVGLHPFKKTRKIEIVSFFFVVVVLIVLVFLRFRYEEVTFALISDTFEGTFSLFHALIKFVVLVFGKTTLKKLIKATNKFWFSSEFHPNFRKETDTSLEKLVFFVRLFLFFMSTGAVIFHIKFFITGQLPIKTYIPEFIPLPIFATIHEIYFSICVFSITSFDMLICALVSLIAVQLRTLNHVISSLNIRKIKTRNEEKLCLEKLSQCIEHHIFLKKFLSDVSSMVSPALLMNFTIAPLVICFELFFASKSSNYAEKAKSSIYLAGIMIQIFFLYCLPVTYLMIQSEKMINVMYNTGWEQCHYLSVKKTIIIMMQNMQQEIVLTAGKMIKINMETCTSAFQMGFSFYTSLQLLDEKQK